MSDVLEASTNRYYYVVEMCSSSLLQGDSTHRYTNTHYCFLSRPSHDSKTLLMTPPATVHQEVEIYEPLILMPYILVFPWQPAGQIYPHIQVCTCVCMHVCVYVCMMWGIRGNIELKRLYLSCAGVCLPGKQHCELVREWQWCCRGDDERRNYIGKDAGPDCYSHSAYT